MRSIVGQNSMRYPVDTDCGAIAKPFHTPDGSTDVDKFKEYASHDKDYTQDKKGAGIYQCYCKQYSNFETLTSKADLCYTYQTGIYTGKVLSTSVTILVSLINMVIKKLNLYLINRIGLHTIS